MNLEKTIRAKIGLNSILRMFWADISKGTRHPAHCNSTREKVTWCCSLIPLNKISSEFVISRTSW